MLKLPPAELDALEALEARGALAGRKGGGVRCGVPGAARGWCGGAGGGEVLEALETLGTLAGAWGRQLRRTTRNLCSVRLPGRGRDVGELEGPGEAWG